MRYLGFSLLLALGCTSLDEAPLPETARMDAISSGPTAGAAPARPSSSDFMTCFRSFRPRARPDLDLDRLVELCGNDRGMRRRGARAEGVVGESAERRHVWILSAADCVSVFAVGAPSVVDLDIELFGPEHERIGFDTSDDRWPIVRPDGPVCVESAGEHSVLVRAQRGSGRYALELWVRD